MVLKSGQGAKKLLKSQNIPEIAQDGAVFLFCQISQIETEGTKLPTWSWKGPQMVSSMLNKICGWPVRSTILVVCCEPLSLLTRVNINKSQGNQNIVFFRFEPTFRFGFRILGHPSRLRTPNLYQSDTTLTIIQNHTI